MYIQGYSLKHYYYQKKETNKRLLLKLKYSKNKDIVKHKVIMLILFGTKILGRRKKIYKHKIEKVKLKKNSAILSSNSKY